jgi:hypothetical protein
VCVCVCVCVCARIRECVFVPRGVAVLLVQQLLDTPLDASVPTGQHEAEQEGDPLQRHQTRLRGVMVLQSSGYSVTE